MGRDNSADDVYFIEQESIKAYPRFTGARIGDTINRLISGYGVKPARLILWALILLSLSSAVFLYPGFARPVTTKQEAYRCDETPTLTEAIGLGFSALAPGGNKVIDDWKMSDCRINLLLLSPPTGYVVRQLPFGIYVKPFEVIGLLSVLAIVLIPFLIAQLTALWRYAGSRR